MSDGEAREGSEGKRSGRAGYIGWGGMRREPLGPASLLLKPGDREADREM